MQNYETARFRGGRDYHVGDISSSSISSSFVVDDMQDFGSIPQSVTSSPRPTTTTVFDDLSDDVIVFVKDLPRLRSDSAEDGDDKNDRWCGETDGDGWEIVPSNPCEGATALAWELESVSSSILTTSRRTFRDVLLSSVDEEETFQPKLVINRQKEKTTMKKLTIETSIDEFDINNDDSLLEDIRDCTKSCRGGKIRHFFSRERKQGGGSKRGQQRLYHQQQERLHGGRQTTDKFGRACRSEREKKKLKTMCRKKMYY